MILRRLAADRPEIEAALGGGRPAGRVLEVRSGLSDPHDGGRTVAVVRFASGLRVVYKPRPVGLEAAFSRLLQWWNRSAGGPELVVPRVLVRRGYGWMEFVAHEPCADRRAAGRYYERRRDADRARRAARRHRLALRQRDRPRGAPRAGGPRDAAPAALARRAALAARYRSRPSWIRGPDGGSYDVSGFGAIAPQRYGDLIVPLRENVVRIGDEVISPATFDDRLVTGFRSAAAVLCARRKELVAAGGPLRGFRRLEVRVILRHTETYRAARDSGSALGPESLLRRARAPYTVQAIAKTERAALRRGDIPRFVASTESSVKALMARVRRLRPARCEEQAGLLSTGLALWQLGSAMAPGVQQRHERDVEERGPREQKHDETAHARAIFL